MDKCEMSNEEKYAILHDCKAHYRYERIESIARGIESGDMELRQVVTEMFDHIAILTERVGELAEALPEQLRKLSFQVNRLDGCSNEDCLCLSYCDPDLVSSEQGCVILGEAASILEALKRGK